MTTKQNNSCLAQLDFNEADAIKFSEILIFSEVAYTIYSWMDVAWYQIELKGINTKMGRGSELNNV